MDIIINEPREPSVLTITVNGEPAQCFDFRGANDEGIRRCFSRLWGDDSSAWPEWARNKCQRQ